MNQLFPSSFILFDTKIIAAFNYFPDAVFLVLLFVMLIMSLGKKQILYFCKYLTSVYLLTEFLLAFYLFPINIFANAIKLAIIGLFYLMCSDIWKKNNFSSNIQSLKINEKIPVQESIFQKNQISSFYLLGISLLALFSLFYFSNFLAIYLALEVYGLSAYTLTGFSKNPKGLKASAKYYLIGSLGSFFILLGILLTYKNNGHLFFDHISMNFFFSLDSFLFFLGVLLKLGVAPVHTWVVEVYRNTPFFYYTYFLTLPKLLVLGFFFYLLNYVFPINTAMELGNYLTILAYINIIIGSLSPLTKKDLKDLLTLSSLSNFGFALLGISSLNWTLSIIALVFYFFYTFVTITLLSQVSLLKVNSSFYLHSSVDTIKKALPTQKGLFILILLNLSGLPPFTIFFGKLGLLIGLVKCQAYFSAVALLIFSAIGSFYYVHLLKLLLNQDQARKNKELFSKISSKHLLRSSIDSYLEYLRNRLLPREKKKLFFFSNTSFLSQNIFANIFLLFIFSNLFL